MRLAWIVLAHARPQQLAWLIRRLDQDDDLILLHVDRTAGPDRFAAALADSRVQWLPSRRTPWGGFGLVRAALDGLGVAAAQEADYLLLVSGSDYPIKPIHQLRARLEADRAAAYMVHFALPNPDWDLPEGGLTRLLHRHYRLGPLHLELPSRRIRLPPPRKMPLGMRPYAGSMWWTMSLQAAKYVLDFLAREPGYLRFFRRVAIPDESFFHTLLLNSPLADDVRFEDLRHIVWPPGASHPATLDTTYLPSLAASRGFIARKFDSERDPEVLREIDRRLLGVDPAD